MTDHRTGEAQVITWDSTGAKAFDRDLAVGILRTLVGDSAAASETNIMYVMCSLVAARSDERSRQRPEPAQTSEGAHEAPGVASGNAPSLSLADRGSAESAPARVPLVTGVTEAIDVTCPTCGQPPGKVCRSPDGELTAHEEREPRRERASVDPSKLLDLCDSAVLNHCPNDPACEEDEPLDHEDWCGVCLLVHDVRAMVSSREGAPNRKEGPL